MAPCAPFAAGLLLVLSPAAAVQSKLAVHAAQQASARSYLQRVEQVLRSRTAQLKRALWDKLGPVPGEYLTSDWADDARELLAQEADYLAAEDDYAASLLHNYARSPFVPLLAVGFEPPVQSPPAFVDGFGGFQEEEAEEEEAEAEQQEEEEEELEEVESSETTRRCRGRTCVKTTRRCSGRTCVTEETVEGEAEEAEVVPGSAAPDAEDQFAVIPEAVLGDSAFGASPEDEWDMPAPFAQPDAAPEDQFAEIPEAIPGDGAFPSSLQDVPVAIPAGVLGDAMASAADMVGDAVRVAARGLAKGLKQAVKSSGLPPLGDILGRVMNSTAAKDFAKSVSSGNVSNAQMNVALSGENLTKAFHDVMGVFSPGGFNISKVFAPGSMLANAESVSTVTRVEDGRRVRHVRRCKKGQCTTTTEEVAAEDEPEN